MNKTLKFVLSLQQPNGAFLGWPDGPEYPEITGYLIPTLIQWGQLDAALNAAHYLLDTQNEEGSWNGVDGVPAAFDTGACVEGLRLMGTLETANAAERGKHWLRNQPMKELYHIRVFGILKQHSVMLGYGPYPDLRSHYWAYALEGNYLLGNYDVLREELEKLPRGMQPYRLSGVDSDTCATAQIAKLRLLLDMDAGAEITALRGLVNHDGSLPHDLINPKKVAWACKYYLDCEYLIKEKGMDINWYSVREWEFKKFDISIDKWLEKKPFGLSGCFRVRNDHEFLYEAVTSHLPYLSEAVIALQPSDKETEKVVAALAELPNVRVVRYPVGPVFITDPEWEKVPENSINSFVYLSNWALAQCKYSWVARIEGDVIALSTFAKIWERIEAEPDNKVLYGRIILNVAGENQDMISATNPRNGGWDEAVFPNHPDYHFIKRPKYEVLESPHENINMGFSALHMKRCKKGNIGWNNETYVPFDRENVAAVLREFNKTHPYPGSDNEEGPECLFEDVL